MYIGIILKVCVSFHTIALLDHIENFPFVKMENLGEHFENVSPLKYLIL